MAKSIGNLQTRLKALEEQFEKLRHQRLAEQSEFQSGEGIRLARIGQGGGQTGVRSNCEILAATALEYWRLMKSLDDPEQQVKAMAKAGYLLGLIGDELRGKSKQEIQREMAGVSSKVFGEMVNDVWPRFLAVLPIFRNNK